MSWGKKSIHFTLLAAVLVLLTCSVGRAQNLRKIERNAIEYYNEGNFVKARDQFLLLSQSDWNPNLTTSYLASCYLELDQPLKSYDVLTKIDNPDQVNSYLRILTNYYLEKFEEAERLIDAFQDTAGYDIQAMSNKIDYAQQSYNNNKGIIVQNFGPEINSKDLEYSAVMYNDFNKLLFTSRKEEGTNVDIDGLAFENIFYTQLDKSDNWEKAIPFSIEVKKQSSHDATVQVYDSGDKIILYHDGQLYSASLKDGVWSKDENLILHDQKGSDTHCFITADEKTIFFASDYLSDGEQLDLFVSQKNGNGDWSEPRPLSELNSEFDEDSPFLANDSTFYFSSNGDESMGGYDVFKSIYDSKKKQWGVPVNLGYPINTVADDIYYTTEGKLAYLSSNRLGGYGSLDLYRVFLFNRVKVQGRLMNKEQQPIPDAEIDIKYEDIHLKSYTDSNGDYELFVPVNAKMHITFIKDSLNLFEGDYIANIFFEDQNHNEFNFLIDYTDENSENIDGQQDNQVVRHLNIDVKNGSEKNPILESVSSGNENKWSDSLNNVAKTLKTNEMKSREQSIVSNNDEETTDIISSNFKLKDATIHEKITSQPDVLGGEESRETVKKGGDSKATYTVQILAMSRLQPDQTYFKDLDDMPIKNKEGSDGLNRFFTGEYQSLEDALEMMRLLRNAGYKDAFIRKIDRYSEL